MSNFFDWIRRHQLRPLLLLAGFMLLWSARGSVLEIASAAALEGERLARACADA